ncbi:hypothetical protein A0H81_03932 [Grifola frondosa]|uniref:FIST domain-containing protein n=1 Tax=Grifola frondosa TaxID=5627 RepID=A0A1C7MIK2_GRIFR|nr:hypothetical protein A0H81_03932 [Grifola frondosa]
MLCAVFDEKMATPFRSTIPGRKAAQVGRWHSFHKEESRDRALSADPSSEMDWEDIWTKGTSNYVLPPELENLSANSVNAIVYFYKRLSALSTPFITGRPFTLFYGTSIHADGAVGLCLSLPTKPTVHATFPGLQSLTRPLIVTSSEGNLVNSLDNANPSRILLSAIHNQSEVQLAGSMDQTMRDDKYYLGTLRQSGGIRELFQLFHITSGDPSRGTLALESDAAPEEGTLVQMFRLPAHIVPDTLSAYLSKSATLSSAHKSFDLTFVASSDETSLISELSEPHEHEQTFVLDNTFLAASEHGFTVSRALPDEDGRPVAERSWRCTIPGGRLGLQWGF